MTTITRRMLSISNPDSRIGFEREESDDGQTYGDDFLTIDGVRAVDLGFDCASCTFIFTRNELAPLPMSPHEVSSVLADGLTQLDDRMLETISEIAPSGDYVASLLPVKPRLVSPGSTDDYFTHEYKSSTDRVHDPGQPYYRGASFRFRRALSADDEAFHELIVPLYPPESCDHARVSEFRSRLRKGVTPTAIAVSLCDAVDRNGFFGLEELPDGDVVPSSFVPDPPVQWVMTHYLLDGHHKVRAAAEEGSALNVLSLLREKARPTNRAGMLFEILERHQP